MPFLVFKFLHVGSMFLATALAVGPSVLLYRIARTGDLGAIRRAFAQATTIFRAAAAFYGLGILFGIVSAITGQLDLTARWLLLAYVLIGVLIAINGTFERWVGRVDAAANDGAPMRLAAVVAERTPQVALAGMIVVSVLIVFVMVVKPTVF